MTQAMTTMEDLSPAEPYTPQTTESAERITRTDALPVTGRDLASLPKDQRLSLKKMARFFWEQYVNGLAARRHHAIAWTMVRSFMRGIHYFGFNKAGQWFIIRRKEGEIRAVTPVLRSQVRHILGFLASNPLGVSTIPVAGSSTSLYKSERTRDILTGWIDDADVHSFASRANGLFLLEGMVGFHRYIDAFRKNVFLRALPASEMFPIPYDAKDPSEMHGLMHVSLVTRQWLELQDENYERVMGRPPINRMADRAKSHDLGMRLDLPSVGAGGSGGKLDGALGITVWMRGNEKMPSGEYVFMLGERIYRYSSDLNVPEIVKFLMPKGMEPVEVARYDENPDDWWGSGPAEAMLASQFSMDRQMTHLEKSARSNRAWTFVDSNVVNVADLGDEDSPLVQMNQDRLEPPSRYRRTWFPPSR
ncbi:hypothetical protein AMJ71_06130 [candidate division TA06 bacterium SM1_40]|uniref:Uncharacterized protein n=1 Tax=candidate division TA06 bacterium SM1_40 TaxID=1703773 RepID=A0A0S8JIK5_UNCT6|nr:MAG: hypothetical protein AMJ71_06130 [candidate division TA06 bacterium SM1_40]